MLAQDVQGAFEQLFASLRQDNVARRPNDNLAPNSDSSCRICMLTAAWVTCTRCAPAVNVPDSAMAMKARSCPDFHKSVP